MVQDTKDKDAIEESNFLKLFEGNELSEEIKENLQTIFEASVSEAVNSKVEALKEEYQAEFDKKLEEAVESNMVEVVEGVDKYISLIAKEWLKENKLQVEAGIKVEMAESLLDGLKDLFYEHNVKIEESEIDVVSELESQISESDSRISATINENLDLQERIRQLEAKIAFDDIAEGLTVSQVNRLKVLSENLDASDVEGFKKKLGVLKESFIDTKTKKVIVEDLNKEEDAILNEGDNFKRAPVSEHPQIAQYANVIGRYVK